MGIFPLFLIFSFQTHFYFSILPWSWKIKHHNFSGIMLTIFFFLPAPFPGRRTRRDKREIKTHWDNLHKSFLNHCMGHAIKTTKLTPMSVWAIGWGTICLFVCPLLLDFQKDPTYPGLWQALQSGFHYINDEIKDTICSAKPFRGMCCPAIAALTHSWYICFTSFPMSLHMGQK